MCGSPEGPDLTSSLEHPPGGRSEESLGAVLASENRSVTQGSESRQAALKFCSGWILSSSLQFI